MIKLSIVILSYNTKDLILCCLKSIRAQYKKELLEGKLEIVVVDNHSTDGSPSAINNLLVSRQSGQFAINNLKLINNQKNLGFAKGCNIGAEAAKGKYVLFLNSDTQVENNGFLQMIEFLEKNSKVAILGGKLYNADGSAQPSTGKFYDLPYLVIILLGFERLGFLRSSPDRVKKVDWVSGACMMIRHDVLERLCGFDEKFFMYLEDMEICFRAQKFGLATYFYPYLKLKHRSLGSSNKTFAIINIYKGILHFYSKHKTYFEYLIVKTLLVVKAEILILIGFLTFNSALRDRYRKAIS